MVAASAVAPIVNLMLTLPVEEEYDGTVVVSIVNIAVVSVSGCGAELVAALRAV